MSDVTYQHSVDARKNALADFVAAPLAELAARCAAVWGDTEKIDEALRAAVPRLGQCVLLYVWDANHQVASSMIGRDSMDASWVGKSLRERPFLKNRLPFKGVMVSRVYTSEYDNASCVTVLQAVRASRGLDARLLGFIAADFRVDCLVENAPLEITNTPWRQYRGDPAVRGTLFMQSRAESRVDRVIDATFARLHLLMSEYGVFHSKILFSSNRCSLWFYDDPYQYQLLDIDEVVNDDILLAYPRRPYPGRAVVTPEHVENIFAQLKALRFVDETLYLRSGSLNIINGMVGLTFSCDGSHYMHCQEFLDRDMSFWSGIAEPAEVEGDATLAGSSA